MKLLIKVYLSSAEVGQISTRSTKMILIVQKLYIQFVFLYILLMYVMV